MTDLPKGIDKEPMTVNDLKERKLLPNEVWKAVSELITDHIGLFGKMIERDIHPNLAKSAVADLAAYGLKCCEGKHVSAKLECPVHLMSWVHAEAVARLYNAIEIADAAYNG
jgi:hypothetical protein